MTVSQNCPCAPTPGAAHKLSYIAGSAYCEYCKQKVVSCCEGEPMRPDADAHGRKRP